METDWTGWLWHATYNQYYRYKINAYGQQQIEWDEGGQSQLQSPTEPQPQSHKAEICTPHTSWGTQNSGSEHQSPDYTRHGHNIYAASDAGTYSTATTSSGSQFGGAYNASSANDSQQTVRTLGQQVNQGQQTYQSQQTHQGYQHYQNVPGYGSLQPITTQTPTQQTSSTTAQSSTVQPSLRKEYKRLEGKDKIMKFFVPGKVFSTLWIEPAGPRRPGSNTMFTVVQYKEEAFAEIRRFIVMKSSSHQSLPISTYEKCGVTNRHDATEHSVAYSTDHVPGLLPGEAEKLTKYAIKINLLPTEEHLHRTSRINFGKTFTVEHNLKVKALGNVDKASYVWARNYWKEYINAD